jgi:hypothetical protein
LATDNTDPLNPVVEIAVDGTTITGDGTPANPLVASPSSSGVQSVTGLATDNTDPSNPIVEIAVDTTLTGDGTPANPLGINSSSLVSINPTDNYVPVRTGANTFSDSNIVNDVVNGVLKTNFGGSALQGFYIEPLNFQFLLFDFSSIVSIDWYSRLLNDTTGTPAVDYFTRALKDSTNTLSVQWQDRKLFSKDGMAFALEYSCRNYKTTSRFYQNDFIVSPFAQVQVINDAVANQELWWSGHVIQGIVDSSVIEVGSLVALFGGSWNYADFSTSNPSAINMVGIWLGDNNILLDGHIVCAETGVTTGFPILQNMSPSLIGSVLYGSEGSPKFNIQKPTTTGAVIRRLGHTYFEDSMNTGYYIMLFRPSNDFTLV